MGENIRGLKYEAVELITGDTVIKLEIQRARLLFTNALGRFYTECLTPVKGYGLYDYNFKHCELVRDCQEYGESLYQFDSYSNQVINVYDENLKLIHRATGLEIPLRYSVPAREMQYLDTCSEVWEACSRKSINYLMGRLHEMNVMAAENHQDNIIME